MPFHQSVPSSSTALNPSKKCNQHRPPLLFPHCQFFHIFTTACTQLYLLHFSIIFVQPNCHRNSTRLIIKAANHPLFEVFCLKNSQRIPDWTIIGHFQEDHCKNYKIGSENRKKTTIQSAYTMNQCRRKVWGT